MDEKRRIIFGNGNIMTLGENNRYIEKGSIYAEDGIIKDIDTDPEIRSRYPDAEYEDLRGLLILPGNVMAHTHLYSAFARGMGLKDQAPSNFVEILERLWWRLDKVLTAEDNYFSGMAGLIQCIKYGTTTIIDHHASPSSIEGSLDWLSKAVLESGIRASLCYEVTDRGGMEERNKGIEENVRFLKKCRDYHNSYLRGAFGIHASFTVSDETLIKCLESAREFNAIFHLHIEEDLADRLDSEKKYGMPVLARLKKLGLTQLPILAIHCVHLAEEEFKILQEEDIMVVHNPQSNMNNAVGVAPVERILNQGTVLGLGTDGMTADLFQEIKVLPLLHKIHSRDPRTYSFDNLYKTIYINNSRIAGRFWTEAGLGFLEPGAYCDFIGLNYSSPTPVNANNILGHIIFGINSSMVDTTVVNAQTLMKKRNLLHIDEEKIMFRCRKLAEEMWKRF